MRDGDDFDIRALLLDNLHGLIAMSSYQMTPRRSLMCMCLGVHVDLVVTNDVVF